MTPSFRFRDPAGVSVAPSGWGGSVRTPDAGMSSSASEAATAVSEAPRTPLRAVRTAIPADHAGTEPAGAVAPRHGAPAPSGSDQSRFLQLARAE